MKKCGKNRKKSRKLLGILHAGIKKTIPKKKFALLFSGGIDSTLLALLLKEQNACFRCCFVSVGTKEMPLPKDLKFAVEIAGAHGLKLERIRLGITELEKYLEEMIPIIGTANPVHVGAALPFFAACKKAGKEGVREIFSGMGADELFAGYARFFCSKDLQKDCREAFEKMKKNELAQHEKIARHFGMELKAPFLGKEIIDFAFCLPKEMKILGKDNKLVLRKAALELGLKKEFAFRKKLAAQYGGNFDRAIEKLSKKKGFKRKSDYLNYMANEKLRIGALFSSGKDSCLALWIMKRQNCRISCLISLQTKNPDSFMFHKPDAKTLKLQSEAAGIPLFLGKTLGEKEKELADLKKTIAGAKKKFGLDGIVSGAVASNYQKQRIQKICEELGLKLFSPLWGMKQDKVLEELFSENFEFIFTKIAGLGLGKEWLGRKITLGDLERLKEIEKKTGFNVAGEGGEFESLVLNAPFFSKKLEILESKIIMKNENSGELAIKKAVLKPKKRTFK